MTWVLYPACSTACAPKGHSLQGLRIRFCSNVFWRVKQQIWYSREVFSKPRLYSHLNTSKKSRDFEDLLRAWALSSPVTFLTGDHVYKSDLTRSHLRVLTMINCIEPPLGALGTMRDAGILFQGGKTFCASFCASLIAGSRRAFLCVDRVRLCLFVTERVLAETEWNAQGVNVCFSKSLFTFVCGFCSSSLENSFGLGTADVKAKTDHSVSLRWNKKFWAFSKRRVFFWLCIGFYICELISPSFAGLN